MRVMVRVASAICGVLAVILLALLIATAVTGSIRLAAVTGAVGVLGVIGVVVLVDLILRRAARTRDRSATRLTNLERRAQSAAVAEEARGASFQELQASIRRELDGLDARTADTWALSTQSALQLGRRPQSFLSGTQAQDLFQHYLDSNRLLEAGPLLKGYPVLATQKLGTLRSLYRFYRSAGYWGLAETVLEKIATASQGDNDRSTLHRLRCDIDVFSDPASVTADLPSVNAHSATGPVLHMVGKMLPDTQSGYTLRTHYTARAQARRGLPVIVVGQSGIAEGEDTPDSYSHDGIEYRRLRGPHRRETDTESWLRHDIQELSRIVRELRPSVLHAHSDFHNAVIADVVGRAHGVPTVYESRGFWEESWLTRTIARHGWEGDIDSIFATYGAPEAYALRKHAEEVARTLPDHNFTLAEVMKDHILDCAPDGLAPEEVTVVPNAVDPEEFPVQQRDPELAAGLGLPEDALIIGYISSMVEYEGIETLIDGFRGAAAQAEVPLHLLLVGAGDHLAALRRHAEESGAENIHFVGAVPHADVLRYYGLIDIFVVPRRRSPVGELVTPLKPFEAFATGRTVVLSNVAALKEIAEESGAAETFRAGDADDLTRTLISLAADPQRRRHLGVRGARWVRGHRTWDTNVAAYLRVYRRLGYRGPADPAVDTTAHDADGAGGVSTSRGRRRRTWRRVGSQRRAEPSESGPRGDLRTAEIGRAQISAPPDLAPSSQRPGTGRRAVVVAMKPQIAGRIRRNIITLLELGFEVTVVNSAPRADFFQGLAHPLLSADFIEVRSLAVRYQARMTRKKNERQARWDEQKRLERTRRAAGAAAPSRKAPTWMTADLPGTDLALRLWTSAGARDVRERLERAWTTADKRVTKFVRNSRSTRDLAIRDQLKQVHLINRFVEFWRLSPERIAAHAPDLVVSSDLPGLVGASIAARRLGVPHLHDCHELYLESTSLRPYERRLLWPFEKAYMRRADAVVVVNETIRNEYRDRYGVEGTVLRNAAPAVPESVRSNPMDIRALAGLDRTAKVVLYQGGLVPGRGLDVCVRAAAHFDDGVHLVLIGKGRSRDELVMLAEEAGVGDRVHFLPAVEPGELPAYTSAADVGVIPYQPVSRNNEYALPNKIFEYTGAGIPVVASDLPELRRIVSTSECGVTYDSFDPVDLARALRDVLSTERTDAYRRNAERYGRANTWESEREILSRQIRGLLGDVER